MSDRQNSDYNHTLFLVTKLSEVIDRTLVFKDDLIMAASETLSTIANKYKQKMQASKKKPSKSQKEKNSTINDKQNNTSAINKSKRRKTKKEINTVFVGVHSR